MSFATIQIHKYKRPLELYFDALDHSSSGYTYKCKPDKRMGVHRVIHAYRYCMINVTNLNKIKRYGRLLLKKFTRIQIGSHCLSIGAQSTEPTYMTENGKQLYMVYAN